MGTRSRSIFLLCLFQLLVLAQANLISGEKSCLYTKNGYESFVKVVCEHSNLTKIPTNYQHREKTMELILRGNQIQSLSKKDFNETPELTNVDLKENQISDIEVGTFSQLKRLRTLNLGHNAIAKFVFDLPQSLIDLDLSFNNLVTLSHGNLDPVYLRTLNVSHNKIEEIWSIDFVAYENLYTLDLSNNLIKTVKHYSLTCNPQLRYLDLSNNKIEFFNITMPELSTLNLRNNPLTNLHLGTSFVDKVLLTNTKMATLPAYEMLPRMTVLDLVGTPIQSLTVNDIVPMCALKMIKVANTALLSKKFLNSCTCVHLTQWMKEEGVYNDRGLKCSASCGSPDIPDQVMEAREKCQEEMRNRHNADAQNKEMNEIECPLTKKAKKFFNRLEKY